MSEALQETAVDNSMDSETMAEMDSYPLDDLMQSPETPGAEDWGDSSADLLPELTGKPQADEQAAPEPETPEPETPEQPDDGMREQMIEYAVRNAGISLKEANELADNGHLETVLRHMERIAGPQTEPETDSPDAPIPGGTVKFNLELPDYLDDELASVLTKKNDHDAEQMSFLQKQVENMNAAIQNMVVQDYQAKVVGAVDQVRDQYPDLLGNDANRQRVYAAMSDMWAIDQRRGVQSDLNGLAERAFRYEFATELAQHGKASLTRKLNGAAGRTVSRPSGKSPDGGVEKNELSQDERIQLAKRMASERGLVDRWGIPKG